MHQHVLLYIKQGLEAYQKAFSPVIIIEDQYLQTFVHTLSYFLFPCYILAHCYIYSLILFYLGS